MSFQRTLKRSIELQGVGLHSGKQVHLRIKPARANYGIVFVRKDSEAMGGIPAHFKYVVNTQLATTLGRGRVTVSTVEHLLAAFQGYGIDNALVEVDAPEIPILDGSALPFCEAIENAGIEVQSSVRPRLVLRKRVEIKTADKWAVAEPSSRLEIHSTVHFDHPAIGAQEYHYIEGKSSFADLAGARTFGFLRDIEALKRMGLARGGSLSNAVVLDDSTVMNPEGLRHPDEFVRHKALDALGDFKLSGLSIQAYFRLHRAGHDVHRQLLDTIFQNPDNFEIIDQNNVEDIRQPEKVARAMVGRRAVFV